MRNLPALLFCCILVVMGLLAAMRPAHADIEPLAVKVYEEVAFSEPQQGRYEGCLTAVQGNKAVGRRRALRWVSDGGGVAASYCAVAADLAFDKPRIAAARLSALAGRLVETKAQTSAAMIYEHAGRLWHYAREFDIALESLVSAMQLAPQVAHYKLAAARIHADLKAWREVIALIGAAEDLGDIAAHDIALRGRALMALGEVKQARRQGRLALERDPYDVDALLLRGDLERLWGLKD